MEKHFSELISEEPMSERSLGAVKRIVLPKDGYIVKQNRLLSSAKKMKTKLKTKMKMTKMKVNKKFKTMRTDYESIREGSTDSENSMVDDWPDVLQRRVA